MTAPAKPRTLFLTPTTDAFRLATPALGLVRALQRAGHKVAFAKPVADSTIEDGEEDISVHFARSLCNLTVPEPISLTHAEDQIRSGNISTLLEDIVALVEEARGDAEIVVVEGVVPAEDHNLISDLDVAMGRSLAAEVIAVLSGKSGDVSAIVDAVRDVALRVNTAVRPLAGVMIGRLPDVSLASDIKVALEKAKLDFPLIAAYPVTQSLNAPRLKDVVAEFGCNIRYQGGLDMARMEDVVVAARPPEHLVKLFKPGTLVVTPGDRSDVIMTTALAQSAGMPIAGLMLTCGVPLSPSIDEFLSARLSDLTILEVEEQTFDAATRLAGMDRRVRPGDDPRMEVLMDHTADHTDLSALRLDDSGDATVHMPPPMFRHRLIKDASRAGATIVLPEGDEPRTLRAAAICAEKKIARCQLLAKPADVETVAKSHGITLPAGLEIIDPDEIRGKYIEPMCELRKKKGLTPDQAEAQLEDNVVLGTMMLATGDVEGLVSGAVHTTASTVRPALQLIKTAPGNSIVSSVFFMLMPDQVLVYGDCAINPDPDAAQLAEVAIQSADSAKAFGILPKVAMISYSTGTSGVGADVDKVREATAIVKEKRPDIIVDGPIQYDAASVESVNRQKAPGSPLDGHANVFIFPDLNTGNTTYKAVQRSADVVSVGPMLQGLRKPVNDLSRGALVDDIVYTIALTAIQAGAEKA
ncbi:phosphate acetyltransferase [uncultured Cohaesibacter sp.]|uniref:phosphate acetyltransferase n=1 Tax=uncultured Cohaesibacter sp. TaxID=1002546 RepID=UPI002A0A325A|nr:phosphate acetyltransferase [uncultured Cohaesibacter sp.]